MARAAEVVTLVVWPAAAVAVRAAPPSESSSPVPPSRLAKPAGSAAAMLSFWLASRFAMPPASKERVPCCWPMVPMTIGASILECALDSGQFQASGFDRLLGVAILVLRGAQIA